MTDKAKLLGRVRMYDFALVEVIEYLDGHPDNAAALKYYNEMRTAFDKAAAEYEDIRGNALLLVHFIFIWPFSFFYHVTLCPFLVLMPRASARNCYSA